MVGGGNLNISSSKDFGGAAHLAKRCEHIYGILISADRMLASATVRNTHVLYDYETIYT